jgi:hypothetical protein
LFAGSAYAYTRDARLDKNSIELSYGSAASDPHPIETLLYSRLAFEKVLNEEWSFGMDFYKETYYGYRQTGFFGDTEGWEYQNFEWSFNKLIHRSDAFSACWIFGASHDLNSSRESLFNGWTFMPEIGVAISARIYGPLQFRSNLVLSSQASAGIFCDLPYNTEAGVYYTRMTSYFSAMPLLASVSYKF